MAHNYSINNHRLGSLVQKQPSQQEIRDLNPPQARERNYFLR